MDKLVSQNGRYETVLQNDGNLVVYRDGVPLWASGTAEDQPVPPPPVNARTGRVRLDGRAMADDGGPWLPLGLSFFWPVREAGSRHVADNLAWARARGVDCFRVFGEVQDWQAPYAFGPRDAGWLDRVRLVRDSIMAAGARVAWTLFGGNALTPAEQMRLVEDLLVVCQERPDGVQYVEVSNESQGFQDADGERRMRGFAEVFTRHGYPTALTSAVHGNTTLYLGSAATVATEHFDRDPGEGGWRPVRQPWGYWERQAMPPTFINNEPIGPGSSGASETDPLRLACGAAVTWISGGCAHVIHPAAGIYPKAEQNYWEHPTLEPTLTAVRAMRSLLPPDLPSWARQNHYWSGHPLTFQQPVGDDALALQHGCVRAYAATRGPDWICLPIGVMRGTRPDGQLGVVEMDQKAAGSWSAFDPLTGALVDTGSGRITLQAERLLVGRLG